MYLPFLRNLARHSHIFTSKMPVIGRRGLIIGLVIFATYLYVEDKFMDNTSMKVIFWNNKSLLIPMITNSNTNITIASLREEQTNLAPNFTHVNNVCPETPPNLYGPIQVNRSSTSVDDLERLMPTLFAIQWGGAGRPSDCGARHRVAVIVPYRDRAPQLAVFLRHIHPILLRQQLDYRIFLIEQTSLGWFNKGVLFNAGVLEMEKRFPGYFTCLILQDVDILPENDNILYKCTGGVTHLSTYIDRYRYRSMERVNVGGILAIGVEQYKTVNGYSNAFYGWGGEDNDFDTRLKKKNIKLKILPTWARCASLVHGGRKTRNNRYQLLRSVTQRMAVDGINSVSYTFMGYQEKQLYTHFSIELSFINSKTYLKSIRFS